MRLLPPLLFLILFSGCVETRYSYNFSGVDLNLLRDSNFSVYTRLLPQGSMIVFTTIEDPTSHQGKALDGHDFNIDSVIHGYTIDTLIIIAKIGNDRVTADSVVCLSSKNRDGRVRFEDIPIGLRRGKQEYLYRFKNFIPHDLVFTFYIKFRRPDGSSVTIERDQQYFINASTVPSKGLGGG